jgi:hypothetical protein
MMASEGSSWKLDGEDEVEVEALRALRVGGDSEGVREAARELE